MWAWLQRTFDSVRGRIDSTVVGWISDLLNGLYGYLHAVFSDVTSGWHWFASNIYNLRNSLGAFVDAVYRGLAQLARVVIPAVINEYRTLIHDVSAFVSQVLAYAQTGIDYALHFAERIVGDAVNWVRDNVYTPLFNFVSEAWRWVTHEGAIVYYYITHPAALAELLFDDLVAILERDAWIVADKLGKFFLSLIVRNLKQFATLIEDILDAIL